MRIVEDNCVGDAPFFSALSEADRRRVSDRMHLEVHRRGETLFRKGEQSTALYLIKSGWVRLLADGGVPIASEGPGSLVGETDVFLSQPRSIGAAIAQEAELWVLTDHDLVELVAENPQMGFDLGDAFGSRLAQLDLFLVERRLKQVPSMAGLGDSLLLAIAHRLSPVARRGGEAVFERGETPQGLFLIELGRVQVEKAGTGGSLVELGPGEMLGEMALLTGAPYRQTARAAADVTLWSLPAAGFEALTAEFPQLRRAMSTSVQESLTSQDKEQAAERLAKMPLFAGQSREVLLAVAERMVVRYVPAGEMVFSEGAPGDSLYVIDSGQIEIATSARAGSEILARMGPDQFFGEMALLTGKPRMTAARAMSDSSLWALSRSSFEDLALRYPSISLALSRVLSDRLAEMDRRYSESQLRRMRLLSGMSSSQLEEISRRLRQVRFHRGQVILREGDPGEELILLDSGRVQLTQGSGRDACGAVDLGAGDVVGELALLTGNPQAETVAALSEVSGWALAKADFDQLVAANPSLALALSRVLSERLHSASERRVRAVTADEPVVVTSGAATRGLESAQERAGAPTVPMVRERAVRPAVKAVPARREPRTSPLAGVKAALESAAVWFGSLSLGAKLRLVLIALLLIWLIGVAVPSLLIRTLAADNVTDLTGAIAFVQRDTSVVARTLETEMLAETALQAAGSDARAQVAPVESFAEQPPVAEPVLEATQAPPTPVPATATPWVIVVTSTPMPATDTPVPTATPLPTATPKPKAAAAAVKPAAPTQRPQPARELDPRLGSLNVTIAEPAGLNPGQSYYRLVRVLWQNENEAAGDHTIYIEVLDENGARLIGQGVQIDWAGGSQVVYTENKPPTEYPANFPMYATLGSYSVSIAGQPSDRAQGLGMGTAEQPAFKVHTNFKLVYQRTTW